MDCSKGDEQEGALAKNTFSAGKLVDTSVVHEGLAKSGSLGIELNDFCGSCASVDDGSAEEEIFGSPANWQACSKDDGEDGIVSKFKSEDLFKVVDEKDGQPGPETEIDDGAIDGSGKERHVELNGLVDGQILGGSRSGQRAQVVVVVCGAQEPEGEPEREHVNDEGQCERLEADTVKEVQQGIVGCVGHGCELDKVKVWVDCISDCQGRVMRRVCLRSRPKNQPMVISSSLQATKAPICHGSFKLRLTAASGAPIMSGTKLYRPALRAGLRRMDRGYANQVGRRREACFSCAMSRGEADDAAIEVRSEGARNVSASTRGAVATTVES